MENKAIKIMFAGGGTGGSVTPLLAVAKKLRTEAPDLELVFVGTKFGPDRELVASWEGGAINFIPLIAGKWRRYFSFYNFLDLFKIKLAFWQALAILSREKPSAVVSAGSFAAVPLVWAAWFKKIPVLIHQQDVKPGLANKLMAPAARVITVTFEKSLIDYGPKALLVGNPIKDLSGYNAAIKFTKEKYCLDIWRPLVLIIGGSTGATAINQAVFGAAEALTKEAEVVHLTGSGKLTAAAPVNLAHYHVLEFLPNEEVLALMAAAKLVVSRAGLGSLTGLSALKKPALVIPMPHSHQEDNAALFLKQNAAAVLEQADLSPAKLAAEVEALLADERRLSELSANIYKIIKPGAAEKIAAVIWEMISAK